VVRRQRLLSPWKEKGGTRLRPPYPPTKGYKNSPTLVNNVETFASIPHILKKGPNWFKSISNNSAGGTKIYMVLGSICRPGLLEAPYGLTLRQLINDFCGGMKSNSSFHFALCGGAAGTIVNENFLDIPIDYQSISKGISLGAGAFLICDQNTSLVEFLRT